MSRIYLIGVALALFAVMGLTIWGQHEHARAAQAKLHDAQAAALQAQADTKAALDAAKAAQAQQQATEQALSQAQQARDQAQQDLAQTQAAVSTASQGQPVMQQKVPEGVWAAIYSH